MGQVVCRKSSTLNRAPWRIACKLAAAVIAAIALAVLLLPTAAYASFSPSSTAAPTEAVTALEPNTDAEVTIAAGEHVWLSFTPAKSGWYEFRSKDNPDKHIDTYGALYRVESNVSSKLRLVVSNDDGGSNGQFLINYKLQEGATYYLACSACGSGTSGSYTAYVSALDPNDVSRMSVGGSDAPFLAGAGVDVRALNINAYNVEGQTVRIGDGLKIAEYYAWDSDTNDYTTSLGMNVPNTTGKYCVELEGTAPYFGKCRAVFEVKDEVSLNAFNAVAQHTAFWSGQEVTLDDLGVVFVFPSNGTSKYPLASRYYEFDKWTYDNGTAVVDEQGNPSSPVSPGSYRAVFAGKNGYTGTVALHVNINDTKSLACYIPVSGETMILDMPGATEYALYVAQPSSPLAIDDLDVELKVPVDPYYGFLEFGAPPASKVEWMATLRPGVDYKIDGWKRYNDTEDKWETLESAPTECGHYEVTFTGEGAYKGNLSMYVGIVSSSDVEGCTVAGVEQMCLLDGSPVSVEPTVKDLSGKKLVPGRDYTYALYYKRDDEIVPYATITDSGEYTLKITGVGSYKGEKLFYIYGVTDLDRMPAEQYLDISGIEDSYAYTGSPVCPAPLVVFDGGTPSGLLLGEHYTVSYSDNVAGPTATVTVTFLGWLRGSISKTFEITGAPAAKPEAPGKKPATKTAAKAKKVTKVTINSKKVTAKTVAKAVKKAGGKSVKYLKIITLGKKVKKISKKAFAKCKKVKKLVLKTKKLTKKGVKNSLKGSKVKTVQVKVGSKKTNKKCVKAYKKIFTKKNCGKKVTVKR